jgi:hypothetical protein
MVKIDKSCMMQGRIGIFTQDELGCYEEDLTFMTLEHVEDYIQRLQEALDRYKKKTKPKTTQPSVAKTNSGLKKTARSDKKN